MTEYRFPRTIEEALQLLETHQGQARIIAGGTDLIPDLRKGKLTCPYLVDITRIPEMKTIQIGEEYLEVGAAVTFAELIQHPYIREHVQALMDAARSVGAGAIQKAATWGGNLVQGMPAADGAMIALALGADVLIQDQTGRNWVPVQTLFRGPGDTAIDPTRQLMTAIRFPTHPPKGTWGTAWRRVGRRSALILPILNCAIRLHLIQKGDHQVIDQVRIALGPAAPIPFRAREAENCLIGKEPSPPIWEEAGKIAQKEAQPRSSVMRASRTYRKSIIPPLVQSTLKTACERALSTLKPEGESHET
jgi:carbon-monoxide dehydrogenase medium subunit